MDYTYLDYFNYYLKEYLSELVNTFPETREPILSNYRPLLEGSNDKNDIYAKCYYTKINNFLTQIATKDETLFETPSKIFIEGVDLYSIWNHSDATAENRTAIWKYLQILMILGRKIMPNHKEIVDMLNKVSNGDVHIPAKVEQTLASADKDETEATPGVFGLGDIASSLGGLGSLASGLGNLGGLGDIGNIINGMKDMFSNPEFTDAMSHLAQQMVPPQPTSQEGGESGEGGEGGEGGESGESTDTQPTQEGAPKKENQTKQSNQSQSTQPPSMFNNPLFSDLAAEIGNTFDFSEMEKDGKPQNIGDALGKFMSGNNPAKLMELVGKFGSKLQNEVKSGNINPADLLKQTMSAAGGQQNLEKMMNNPQFKNKMNQMNSQTATRDRLRAKLDKKNAEKQN
jgi:hypothetical protein